MQQPEWFFYCPRLRGNPQCSSRSLGLSGFSGPVCAGLCQPLGLHLVSPMVHLFTQSFVTTLAFLLIFQSARKRLAALEPLFLLCPPSTMTPHKVVAPSFLYDPGQISPSLTTLFKLHHHPPSTYPDSVPDLLLYIYLIIACFPPCEGSFGRAGVHSPGSRICCPHPAYRGA